MNKNNIFIFAGIIAISFSYVLFLNKSENKIREKFDKESAEAIKKIDGEINRIIKKINNDSNGNDSTKK